MHTLYFNINSKRVKRVIHVSGTHFVLFFIAVIVLSQLVGCDFRSNWEQAKQADSYEAYQNYIENSPDGEFIAEARIRADSLYWESISSDTTAKSFETYLQQFPEGRFRDEAQLKKDQYTADSAKSTEGRVTGSGVIIRSDHTTASPSSGVVANEGTVVQILDRYITGSSTEAILKNAVMIEVRGNQVQLPEGKAIRIVSDQNESVKASVITTEYGRVEATISKSDIEAIDGQTWYKIETRDGITGWIFGKFIEEI